MVPPEFSTALTIHYELERANDNTGAAHDQLHYHDDIVH